MDHCTHTRENQTAVELRELEREPTWVRMGLCCQLCGAVISAQWVAAPYRCPVTASSMPPAA